MHNSLEQLTAYGNVELHTSPHTNSHIPMKHFALEASACIAKRGTTTAGHEHCEAVREVTREHSPTISTTAGCRQVATALRAGTLRVTNKLSVSLGLEEGCRP